MTATAVRPSATDPLPVARLLRHTTEQSLEELPPLRPAAASPAVAYQRVLHQLVRRELRLLAELATWAPADEAARIAALTGHAELVGRVLLHHHAVEREATWPALLRLVPPAKEEAVRAAVADWTDRCARIQHLLRDVGTAGRQWAVAGTPAARNAFALAARRLADAVTAQTATEEAELLPLLADHLTAADWAAIARSVRRRLRPGEQLLVLGLALEDASAADRRRVLQGLPPATRLAWRLLGTRRYRATVVRLRGAPPAA